MISEVDVPTQSGVELFVSTTPNFRYGPGIKRDGITKPRMTDPHSIGSIMGTDWIDLPETTHAFVQRAGTYTLFTHVKRFVDAHGEQYRIRAIQGHGDLTMNPWHVALIHENGRAHLYHLNTKEDPQSAREDLQNGKYQCLVKWKRELRDKHDFINLGFSMDGANNVTARIYDSEFLAANEQWLNERGIDPDNIAPFIEFAFSGKPLYSRGQDLGLTYITRYFTDVRHIFRLPTVTAHRISASRDREEMKINFGEYTLFTNENSRTLAVTGPVVVPLELRLEDGTTLAIDYAQLQSELSRQGYHKALYSEARIPNTYRRHDPKHVKIFFGRNVYPFGAVAGDGTGKLTFYAQGGLSGRVGANIETIMTSFLNRGHTNAIILDEGCDTFQVDNKPDGRAWAYDSNAALLDEIAANTLWQMQVDAQDCARIGGDYPLGTEMLRWPLNVPVFEELLQFCGNKIKAKSPSSDVMPVPPQRSQMRAVTIIAERVQ